MQNRSPPLIKTAWRRINVRWWLFLGIAVALHGVLLLLPLRQAQAPPAPGVLALDLVVTPWIPAVLEEPRQETPELEKSVPEIESATANTPTALPPPEPRKSEPPPSQITANELLEQLQNPDERAAVALFALPARPAEPGPRTLSRSSGAGFSASWHQPVVSVTPGPWAETFLPAKTRILDSWQNGNGDRTIVMRTSNGLTLCGEAARWDPSNPLFEPVMSFRRCSGGGKRDRWGNN